MILAALLAAQAPAATAPPSAVPDDAQLRCTVIGPGYAVPIGFDLDFRAKKQPNAVLAAAAGSSALDTPFARVSSTSAVVRRPDGLLVLGFATGGGQFRLELTPQRDTMRVRMSGADDVRVRPTVAQGFCAVRGGKALKPRPLAVATVDGADLPRPWKLAPLSSQLPDANCRALTRDGKVGQFSYRVTRVQGNELWTAYTFPSADLVGATAAIGSGTQFHLVAPAEHMVATTISLGGNPATFLHITYERTGNFLDLSRDGAVFAVGDCGLPPAWIAAAPGVPR